MSISGGFQTGTNGNNIATGDSGDGNAWDAINKGTGSALTYDNAHAAAGTSLAAKVVTSATAGQRFANLVWSTAFGTLTDHFGRFYIYCTGNPGANMVLVSANGNDATQPRIVLTTTGKLRLGSTSGTTDTTNSIALNQWVRIEYHFVHSTTGGQLQVKLFNNPDSTSDTETLTSLATWNTNANATSIGFGCGPNGPTSYTFWIDQIVAAATAYPGPVPAIPLATAAAVSATTLAITAQTTVTLGSSAAVAATTLALTAQTQIPLGTSGAQSSATLAVTAQTQVPLGASAAAASATLTLAAPTQVALGASAAQSSATLTITAPTSVPVNASTATSSASLAVMAATQIPLAATAAQSSATLAITAPTGLPLDPATALATTALTITAPALSEPRLLTVRRGVLRNSDPFGARAGLVRRSILRPFQTAVTAGVQIPLSTAAAQSSATLAITAATTIPLTPSAAVSTTSLNLTAATVVTLGASTATSSTSLTVTTPVTVPLASSVAQSDATLAIRRFFPAATIGTITFPLANTITSTNTGPIAAKTSGSLTDGRRGTLELNEPGVLV